MKLSELNESFIRWNTQQNAAEARVKGHSLRISRAYNKTTRNHAWEASVDGELVKRFDDDSYGEMMVAQKTMEREFAKELGDGETTKEKLAKVVASLKISVLNGWTLRKHAVGDLDGHNKKSAISLIFTKIITGDEKVNAQLLAVFNENGESTVELAAVRGSSSFPVNVYKDTSISSIEDFTDSLHSALSLSDASISAKIEKKSLSH